MDMNPYKLRRSDSTHTLNNGVDLHLAQELLGLCISVRPKSTPILIPPSFIRLTEGHIPAEITIRNLASMANNPISAFS
jgi:hypothetical protein